MIAQTKTQLITQLKIAAHFEISNSFNHNSDSMIDQIKQF